MNSRPKNRVLFLSFFTIISHLVFISQAPVSQAANLVFSHRTISHGLGNNYIHCVFVVGNKVYAGTNGGGLSISTDGGATFTNRTTADGLGGNYVMGIHVVGSTVYAATTMGLSISTDGGATFTNRTTADGLGDNSLQDVFVDGSNVYAASFSGLEISTDGGASFTNRSTVDGLGDNSANDVYAVGSNIYVATMGGLSISTDAGATYTNRTTANGLGDNAVYNILVNGTSVYASTAGGFSISTDGGANFVNRRSGLGSNQARGAQKVGSTIYVATFGGVSISTNNGANFTNYPTGLGIDYLNDIFVVNSKIYAATFQGLAIYTPPPNVTSSTPNGDFGEDASISIEIQFAETVTVSGIPQLTLETGAIDRVINYESGSGTTTLTFSYLVQAGDSSSDLDYKTTNALSLNGGTITYPAGDNAYIILATPGAANSLSANKAIAIDAVAPVLSDSSTSTVTTAGVTLNFTTNKTGNYYYLVYSATQVSPTAATVYAQGSALAKGSGAATNGINSIAISSLNASSPYKVHFMIRDSFGNNSGVASLSFSTASAGGNSPVSQPLEPQPSLMLTANTKLQEIVSSRLTCTSGKYTYGLPGDMQPVIPTSIHYSIRIGSIIIEGGNNSQGSFSWEIADLPKKGLAVCDTVATFRGTIIFDSSERNGAAYYSAQGAMSEAIRTAESVLKNSLSDIPKIQEQEEKSAKLKRSSDRTLENLTYKKSKELLSIARAEGSMNSREYNSRYLAAIKSHISALRDISKTYDESLIRIPKMKSDLSISAYSTFERKSLEAKQNFAEALNHAGYGYFLG